MKASQKRHNAMFRSSNGCWTCRLRRKKCDEKHPICDVCSSLLITCHFQTERPGWMDGGAKQEKMADRLKREIKQQAHRRRTGALSMSHHDPPATEDTPNV